MAVMQMERIHLCAMKRDRKKILEFLQRRGVVELYDAGGGPEDPVFKKQDTSTIRSLLEKNADTAARAVEILDRYVPYKGPSLAFLRGREAVTPEVNDSFAQRRDGVLAEAQKLLQHEREIAEQKAEMLRYEAQQEALVPWLGLQVPLTFAGTKKTAAFIGQLEGEYSLDEVLASLAQAAPELEAVHVELIYSSRELTCLLVLAPKNQAAKAEEALRSIGFARPATSTSRLPAEKRKQLEERIAQAQRQIDEAEQAIAARAELRSDFVFLQDHTLMRVEKYAAIEQLALSRHTFALDGFVPAACAAQMEQALAERFVCSVDVWPTDTPDMPGDLEVPVVLKNNWFAEPVETVLESYSLPGKGELDPTSVMSIFYYVMFGLMFSDAGYGLIMAGICGVLLLKFRRMEPNWSRYLRMYFWCGVSTVFWGIMFGSYFGNVISAVSGTFFGREIMVKPVWLDPMAQPMTLLIACLGIGVVHLSVGMVMKAATCVKNKQYADIVYDVVFPLFVVYGLIAILVGTELFEGLAGFRVQFPAMATNVFWGLIAVGAVGVLVTGGRESRAWGKRLLKGAYALYNVVAGWLGDILSYSRLLALGLATGVIASVMNTMGTMVGNGVLGFIVFVVVFVVGQALNFGINALGAYVHSNRLEYVEFFGKFYEGGGRKFAPLGIHTKHIKLIEEETHNGN